ncbi:MAG: lasso peptide biosynthesis B2 protein [Polyangiaceae bacterium]
MVERSDAQAGISRQTVAAIDLALLTIAYTMLRFRPLPGVHALLARIGSHLPELGTVAEARRAARGLARYGTCLTRSLAVAARAPTADVVIAVDPRAGSPLFAHAWVEIDGKPIESTEVTGTVIARLAGSRSAAREHGGQTSTRRP